MKKAVGVFCALLCVLNLFAQSAGGPETRLAALDAYLRSIEATVPFPGFSVVAATRDGTIFARGYGTAERGRDRPVDADLLFSIGSLTKSFTALAVLQLVERGLVDLDVPVTRYLPWFRTADRQNSDLITLRMLLSHSSGLPSADRSIFSRDESDDGDLRLGRSLSSMMIGAAPGRSYEYCNEGFAVTGLVIEAVTGLQYHEYLRRNVLEPLGMLASTTDPAVLRGSRRASPHVNGRDGGIPIPEGFLSLEYIAAGSVLNCSARDLGRYLSALLAAGTPRSPISAATRELLWAPVIESAGPTVEQGGDGRPMQYCLGWVRGVIEGRTVINHGGNTGSMSSFTALIPESGLGVSILTNIDMLDGYRFPSMMNIVNNALHILSGEATTNYGRPTVPDPSTLESYELPVSLFSRYEGRYEALDSSGVTTITIARGAGGLIFDAVRNGVPYRSCVVDFVNEAVAYGRGVGIAFPMRFTLRPDGRVTGLSIPALGMVFHRASGTAAAEPVIETSAFTFRLPSGWAVAETSASSVVGADLVAYTAAGRTDSSDASLEAFAASEAFSGDPDWTLWERRLGWTGSSARGAVQYETFDAYSWFERAYNLGDGNGRSQAYLCLTSVGGRTYGIVLRTPIGQLSQELSRSLRLVIAGFAAR